MVTSFKPITFYVLPMITYSNNIIVAYYNKYLSIYHTRRFENVLKINNQLTVMCLPTCFLYRTQSLKYKLKFSILDLCSRYCLLCEYNNLWWHRSRSGWWLLRNISKLISKDIKISKTSYLSYIVSAQELYAGAYTLLATNFKRLLTNGYYIFQIGVYRK